MKLKIRGEIKHESADEHTRTQKKNLSFSVKKVQSMEKKNPINREEYFFEPNREKIMREMFCFLMGIWSIFSFATAQEFSFQVKSSEKLEALLLLDLMDSSALPTVQFWEKIKTEALESTIELWKGRGQSLVILLAWVEGDTLEELIRRLRAPELIFSGIEEKKLGGDLDLAYLKQYTGELILYLEALSKNKWGAFLQETYGELLQKSVASLQNVLGTIEPKSFLAQWQWIRGVEASLPRSLSVYLVASAPSLHFLVQDRFIFSADLISEFSYYFPYELCQSVDFSSNNRTRIHSLISKDEAYRKAYTRITQQHPLEEEYRFAGALYLGLQSKLLTLREVIFYLKYAYPDSENPLETGAPLAAVVFNKLMEAPLETYPSYDHFLDDIYYHRAVPLGYVIENAEVIWQEVAGISGILFVEKEKRIEIFQVLDGYFSVLTGLESGDVVVKIEEVSLEGKTLKEAKKLLSGHRGEEKSITVKRGNEMLTQRIYLD